jgi:integrase
MRVSLTDRFVASAKAVGAPQADYFDEGSPGLALRVSKGGRKTWTYIFTSPKDDRRARLTIGAYPAISLAAARGRALEARGYLEEKPPRDPRDVWAAETAGAMTVRVLIESYLSKHVRPNRRSAVETERRFARNVTPIIGDLKVADLHRRDINRVVDPVLARGSPVEGARTFEDVRALLRWAARRGDLDRNPAEGMGRPSKSSPRDRVLVEAEIRVLWTGLPLSLARSKTCQRILKLCLVMLQRVGEVSGMQISELDLQKRIWTIPAARSKNKHAHTVPIPDLALTIITEALEAAKEGTKKDLKYVFPNPEGDGPLPAAAVARTVVRAHQPNAEHPMGRFSIAHWTAHDLRRTGVSNMAALGIPPIVLGHVINHRSVTKAGVTLSVYSQYDYAKEKQAALNLWAERLTAIIADQDTAAVIPISKRPKS